MERSEANLLLDFIADHYESDEIVQMQQFFDVLREAALPQRVKDAAFEELPPGEYSKQQLLHEIEGLPVYLHPSGPRGERRR